MSVNIEKVIFEPYGSCVRISNNIVDLIVTLDVGPRVIRYSFVGKENVFLEKTDSFVTFDQDSVWKIKGGHRLWHTPEKFPRNYVPDDDPVEWMQIENGIKVIQKLEKWTQIKKEMEIILDPNSSEVKVIHTLTNLNAWPIEIGLWGETAMKAGGKLVVPQSKRDTGVECNRVMALWPYSDMTDKRVYWGKDYIFLQQDVEAKIPFKFGIWHEEGWAAYFYKNYMFLKKYNPIAGAVYPDYGCSFEAYTNSIFLEVESLSPLKLMQPGENGSHEEKWSLFENIPVPDNEEEVKTVIEKIK